MNVHARWLFGIAAATNFAAGFGLLLFRSFVAPRVGLGLAEMQNVVLLDFDASMIALFGYVYLRVALDPVDFRPLIHVGAISKLLAAGSAFIPWLSGIVPARLPALMSIDIVFALLFFHYLRKAPENGSGI